MYSTTVSLTEAKEIYKKLSAVIGSILMLNVRVHDLNASTFNGDTTVNMIETRKDRSKMETWYCRLGEYTGDLLHDVNVRPVNPTRVLDIFVVFSDRKSVSMTVVPDPATAWDPDKTLNCLLDPNYVSEES